MRFARFLSNALRIKPVIAFTGLSLIAQNNETYYNTPKKWENLPHDNSMYAESSDLSKEAEQIKMEIEKATEESEKKQNANIWVKLEINKISHLYMFVQELGFEIHHATKDYVMLIKQSKGRVIPGEKISPYPSHCAGSGGIVINEKNEILLIKEKKGPRSVAWGFPGGRVDLGESMQEAAVREVKEETGLICEPRDIFLFREMDRALYGRPDIYFLSLLRPLTNEIKLCQDEIGDYKWVPLSELETLLNDSSQTFFPIQRFAINKIFNLYKNGYDFQKDTSVKSFVMAHNSSNYNIYMPTRGFL